MSLSRRDLFRAAAALVAVGTLPKVAVAETAELVTSTAPGGLHAAYVKLRQEKERKMWKSIVQGIDDEIWRHCTEHDLEYIKMLDGWGCPTCKPPAQARERLRIQQDAERRYCSKHDMPWSDFGGFHTCSKCYRGA